MIRLILVLLLGVLAWKVVEHHRTRGTFTETAAPIAAPYAEALRAEPAASPYHCDGRTMCSQMHSCDEATFFLKNCPGVKMDGNHDGVPCELQWCH
jgi:hypothetical protein